MESVAPPILLVVNHDAAYATVLVDTLEAQGYTVWSAETAHDARMLAGAISPRLVVVDLDLPDTHGLLLCTELRRQLDVPIFVVDGTGPRWQSTLALKVGADDVIGRPFDRSDLQARIDAVLRRYARAKTATEEPRIYQVGALEVSGHARWAALGGEEIQLTPTEYRLLVALMTRPGQLVSRRQLAEQAWGYAEAVEGRGLDVHICRLRAKLRTHARAPVIEGRRGVGYRIIVDERDPIPAPRVGERAGRSAPTARSA